MSAQSMGSARSAAPRPPEKGVFPLDHFGDCADAKAAYLKCLDANGGKYDMCRERSESYLKCRMATDLMAPQDMATLGFGARSDVAAPPGQPGGGDGGGARAKHQAGFVAGLHTIADGRAATPPR